MSDERTEVNDAVLVERNLVEFGDTRDVYQRFDAFADAAFEFTGCLPLLSNG